MTPHVWLEVEKPQIKRVDIYIYIVTLLRSLFDKCSWESFEPPYPPSNGLNNSTTVLLEGLIFGIKWPKKVDMPLNNKTNQSAKSTALSGCLLTNMRRSEQELKYKCIKVNYIYIYIHIYIYVCVCVCR